MPHKESLLFRVIPNLGEDGGKNSVRIDAGQMTRMGLQTGGLVTAVGSRNSAVATCAPLDPLSSAKFKDKVVYLDEPSRNVPLIQLSNALISSIGGVMVGGLVQVILGTQAEEDRRKITVSMRSQRPGNLRKTMALAGHISDERFDLIFPLVEIYDNEVFCYLFFKNKIANLEKASNMKFGSAIALPHIEVYDELGNAYESLDYEGAGGMSTKTRDSFLMACLGLVPPSTNARELKIVVRQIAWNISDFITTQQIADEPGPGRLVEATSSPILVATGPWQFHVPLQ